MNFALFTTHTQGDLPMRASTTHFTQQREKSGPCAHYVEGVQPHSSKCHPRLIQPYVAVQHPATTPDQISNRAQPHHLNTTPELTNSVPQHRKWSWPWWCAETTALFLAPKLVCLSPHHTPLHSCNRNTMNNTQTCPKMIQVSGTT